MKSSRFRAVLLFATAFLFACTISAHAAAKESIPVTVLFLNDVHGYLEPVQITAKEAKTEVGGMARIAARIRDIEKQNRENGTRTFVLIAGDILQGTPMSTVFKGAADIDVYNAMGVDALTLGNHEFDFGADNLKALMDSARFPFLSANLWWKKSGGLIGRPSISFPISEGIFLHIIGITTPRLIYETHPDNVADVRVEDPVSTAETAHAALDGKGPVLFLSHSRIETDRAVARALPGVAAIIGGHEHLLLSPPLVEGTVPIFQASEKGRYLGRIDLEVDSTTGAARLKSAEYIPIHEEMPADKEIAAIVLKHRAQLTDAFKAVIGLTRVPLQADRKQIRSGETNFGDFVADAIRLASQADIALLNSGAIRASLDAGEISLEDLFRAFPFDNEIVLVDLTGREVAAMLERSVSGGPGDDDGGFLQVSGIRFDIQGKSVKQVTLDRERQLLDPDAAYRVAVTDFLHAGGDGYGMLKGKPGLKTGVPLRELMVETIRKKREISPAEDGRIRRLP
jgi:2',3'-cyclic-nucleotide 2'-phosphodiesterase (5'-nucleotidase family)